MNDLTTHQSHVESSQLLRSATVPVASYIHLASYVAS